MCFVNEDGLDKEVKNRLSCLKDYSHSIGLLPPQYEALRSLDYQALRPYFVSTTLKEDKLEINGLDEQKLHEAVQFVLSHLASKTSADMVVTLTTQQFHYFKKAKLLQLLEQNYAVKVELRKEDLSIRITGKDAKVAAAKQEVEQAISTLREEKISFGKQKINKPQLKALKQQVEDSHKVNVHLGENEVTITGDSSLDWEAIKKVFKFAEDSWKTNGYNQLYQIYVAKKEVNISKFKEEWNLINIYFDKQTQTVVFTGYNLEDIKGAQKAMEAHLEKKRIDSFIYAFPDAATLNILSYNKSYASRFKIIESIHQVSFTVPKKQSISIRGPAESVKNAVEELKKLVREVSAKITTLQLITTKVFANELAKDNWLIPTKICQETGVTISIPEVGDCVRNDFGHVSNRVF